MGILLIKRYLWLINLLHSSFYRGLTLKEINSAWERSYLYKDCGESELSRRTFINHCNAIEEIWGIKIECTAAGANSRYRIKAENETDLEENTKWLLNSIATEELIAQRKDIPDKILLENTNSDYKYLSAITTALRKNSVLNIDYQSFHIGKEKQTDILVEPLCLKMFKRRWYTLCRRCSDNAYRIYALDRLQKCEATSEHFIYPENFSPQKYFDQYYGISTDGYWEECSVVLKAYRELPKYLKAQPLHHSQKIKEETPEYTLFEYRMTPAFDFVQEIFLHIEQLEVIKPEFLRKHMKEKSELLAGLYR